MSHLISTSKVVEITGTCEEMCFYFLKKDIYLNGDANFKFSARNPHTIKNIVGDPRNVDPLLRNNDQHNTQLHNVASMMERGTERAWLQNLSSVVKELHVHLMTF
jgi:hypothetical protein